MKKTRELPIPILHEVTIKCIKCGNIFKEMVFIEGDWKTCPKCSGVNIHKFCENCNSFYKKGWKDRVLDM